MLSELPFASLDSIADTEVHDLLLSGHRNIKAFDVGVVGFFLVRFATCNAKMAARYFELALGFQEVACRTLETGSRVILLHVVQRNDVRFEFCSSLEVPTEEFGFDGDYDKLRARARECLRAARAGHEQETYDAMESTLVRDFVLLHGMGVMDVAFSVKDLDAVYLRAVANGALPVRRPTVVRDDAGWAAVACIGVPNSDLRHTLVEGCSGPYLPGYAAPLQPVVMRSIPLVDVDHCVQNHGRGQMMAQAEFYARALGFHKFWSVDEADVGTGNTALRLVVMALPNGRVRMPINEPTPSRMRSQIEEFVDYFGGPGVQHIALRTRCIVSTVDALRARGLRFNTVLDDYYVDLRRRLRAHGLVLREDLDALQRLHVLVDFDPLSRRRWGAGHTCNYILQIFSHPVHDKPTLFFEVIQRHHHNGFGKGTFKGLFESIERQQRARGTLVRD